MNITSNHSRRNFIKKSGLTGAGLLTIPSLFAEAFSKEVRSEKIDLKKDAVILFQGDSITDAGRKRDNAAANQPLALGTGYAMLAGARLLDDFAGKNLKIYNRGISGNKVFQLAERWQEDTLDLKPDVVSILVGVNDFWHTLSGAYKGTLKNYEDDFRSLLDRTKQALPTVKLIIGEPFAVPGIKAVDDKWFPAFNDYRRVAREVAEHYKASFIPYQNIFDKALTRAPGSYWTSDGVHPTLAGAQLMAGAWIKAVKK